MPHLLSLMIRGCHYDSHRWCQWLKSWHHESQGCQPWLSSWQPAMPPVRTKLPSLQFSRVSVCTRFVFYCVSHSLIPAYCTTSFGVNALASGHQETVPKDVVKCIPWINKEVLIQLYPNRVKQHNNTENKTSSICRHWWHHKLSQWQITIPTVTQSCHIDDLLFSVKYIWGIYCIVSPDNYSQVWCVWIDGQRAVDIFHIVLTSTKCTSKLKTTQKHHINVHDKTIPQKRTNTLNVSKLSPAVNQIWCSYWLGADQATSH